MSNSKTNRNEKKILEKELWKEHERLSVKENKIKSERYAHLKEGNQNFLKIIEEKELLKKQQKDMRASKHRYFSVRNSIFKPTFKDAFKKALAREVERSMKQQRYDIQKKLKTN